MSSDNDDSPNTNIDNTNNTNNISPKNELITSIHKCRAWVTRNGTVKSSNSKISEAVYNIAVPARRRLSEYAARYQVIIENEKDEMSDDADVVSFNDFVINDCNWTYFEKFVAEIDRRVEEIKEFEPGLLDNLGAADAVAKKVKKKMKKKKKKKHVHHVNAIHGADSNVNNPYSLAMMNLAEKDESDESEEDDDVNDDGQAADPFTTQQHIITRNRNKRLAKRDQATNMVAMMMQFYVQTNADKLDVVLAFLRVLFDDKNMDIYGLKNLNRMRFDLRDTPAFIIKVYFNWAMINYSGPELERITADFYDLRNDLFDIYLDTVSPEGLTRALVTEISMATAPSIFKAKILVRWQKALRDPRYVVSEPTVFQSLNFHCSDFTLMNNCTNKNCRQPHFCPNCGCVHNEAFCPTSKLSPKNKQALRGNISYNASRRGGRGGGRGRNNNRRNRGGGGNNNNNNNYRNRNYNQRDGYNNNNNNNNQPQRQQDQVRNAFDAFMAAANAGGQNNNQPNQRN